ncbi:YhcH/YjgK/YiaL family protein [Candidatus Mycoplasma pogonae]
MIYDKLKNIEKYACLAKNMQTAIDFIHNTDLEALALGKTEIDGEKVFVLKLDVDSYDDSNALYEYHKRYADLHLLVDEKEQFYFDYPEHLTNVVKEYDATDEVALYKKDSDRNLIKPILGEFLFFFPGEAHLPKYTGTLEKIRKIIFKIEI